MAACLPPLPWRSWALPVPLYLSCNNEIILSGKQNFICTWLLKYSQTNSFNYIEIKFCGTYSLDQGELNRRIGGDRVFVHFAVTFLDCQRCARCLFIISVIVYNLYYCVVTQKLVLQQSKNVTARCTERNPIAPSASFYSILLALHSIILLQLYWVRCVHMYLIC